MLDENKNVNYYGHNYLQEADEWMTFKKSYR
jgi:hypothetical protein